MLQNAVWGLRGLFSSDSGSPDAAAVVTQAPGYMLRVAPEQVDLHQFHHKVEEGRVRLGAGAPEQAARLLGDALALWRGPALADLVETGIAWPGLSAVQSARLDVMEDHFEALLACGRHHEVLADLSAMVAAEPFRERSCGQFMTALYRCGRQVEALDAYSRLRSALAEDLGLEPSRELQSLQRAILTHDPVLTPEDLPKPAESRIELRVEPRVEPRPHDTEAPGVAPARRFVEADVSAFLADPGAELRDTVKVTGTAPPAPLRRAPRRRTAAERQYVSLLLIHSHFDDDFEQVDPAEIDEALEGVADTIQDEVQDRDGALALAIGPLSLAVFGLSGTQDCEQRAVQAALAIRDRVVAAAERAGSRANRDPRPRLSLSVVTGEALVRQAQGDGGAPPSVFGALVERCQSLLSNASGGEILVCDRTRRATDATIAYQPVDGPSDVWRVEGTRGAGDRSMERSVAGHELELDAVHGLLEWTWRRGTTHLTTVLGGPGVGKTRFLEQFRAGWTGRPEPVKWLETRIPPFPGNDGMPVLRSLLSALCGIEPEDSPAAAFGRLSTALRRWSDFEPEGRWLSARLAIMFGLKSTDGIEFGPRDALEVCEKFLTSVAVHQPLVLVMDDVHRAPDDVLDFIEGLADLSVRVPLFVITAGRPELLQRRPEWGGGKRRTTTVTLAPAAPGDWDPDAPAVQPVPSVQPFASVRSIRSVRSLKPVQSARRQVPAGVACPNGQGGGPDGFDGYRESKGENPAAG
ncbi:BTAD domain-containing putative transcriptional regulator [Streptomyces violascens]|uniref:BTAD domain-containing putative transcriptional regulator n=1 Tax=Streptomyces violascens TaxID=67381 RepID=UPI00366231AC